MIGWKIKAIAAVATVALFAFAAYKVSSWRNDAIEYKARAAVLERSIDNLRRDIVESEAARRKLSAGLTKLAERFNDIKIPPPKTLVQTVEVPGACPRVGASPEFVSVWNDAASP